MAQTVTKISQSKVINQLDTYNHTALSSTVYTVSVRLDVIPTSGISVVIKNNSSTIITSTAPTTAENNVQVQAKINCAANDVIGVIFTSSTASDQGGNSFKAILDIRQGLV